MTEFLFNKYMMIYLYFFFLGTAIGSFLNVLIDRLPKDKSIMGRSHCDYCKRKLSAIDLIPIFSFLFLNGKCRKCKKKLSWQYPGIEVLTGVVFILVYFFVIPVKTGIYLINNAWIPAFAGMTGGGLGMTGGGLGMTGGGLGMTGGLLGITGGGFEVVLELVGIIIPLGIASILIVIFFTDVKYKIIPDQMQISLFIFSFFFFLIEEGSQLSFQTIVARIVAGIVVMLPILIIYLFTRGKGMGFGDVKLAFNMGILLGLKSGLLALYFGFIFGALYGIILIILKLKKMKSKVAFGPFLILGILIITLLRVPIYDMLLRIYGI